MLQTIRNNSKGLLAKVFIAFIILVFAIFGLDSIVGTFVVSNSSVTVNGVAIDETQVESESQRISQQLLSSLGPDIDLSGFDSSQFREQAIENLIQRELLIQNAVSNDVTVSPLTLDTQIAQTVDFQVDGVFNNERAQAMLTSIGFTPASYRAALKREGLLNQMLTVFSASSFATSSEVAALAKIREEKRTYRLIQIPVAQLAQVQNVDEDEVVTYYDNNPSLFMQDDLVSLEYVELNKNDLLAEVEISEEDILEQYNAELLNLQAEVERRASHILLAASGNEIQDAISRAQDIKTRIDSGESFEDLAAQFSDDTGSAEFGGDVGYTTGEAFVDEFESALKSLELGQVSEPVRTQFGVHLIKLTEMSDNEVPNFDESRDRILRELQDQRVDSIYDARAEELSNLSFETIDLQEPAEILDLEIMNTDLFDRSGGIGIAANPSVIETAFSADIFDGLNSELIALDDSRSVVVRLLERKEPQLKSLAEVRGEIEASLRREKAEEQAESLGETLLSNIENDQNIDSLMELQGLEWTGGRNLTRSSQGLSPEIVQMIFSMSKPEDSPVVEGKQLSFGDYVIVELEDVIPGDIDELDVAVLDNLEAYLIQEATAADFDAYMNYLKQEADIDR